MTTFERLMASELPEYCSSEKAYHCARTWYEGIAWRPASDLETYFSEGELCALAARWQRHAHKLWLRERGAA